MLGGYARATITPEYRQVSLESKEVRVLGIETATDNCSCALHVDGATLVDTRHAPRCHARLILQMVQGLLQRAAIVLHELDGLAFGNGPGSFTGVRIATGVAQGLAFGAGLEVVPISSLRALAQGVYREHRHGAVLCAFDARMSEVYWGAYTADESGVMHSAGPECVCIPETAPMPAGPALTWCGAGPGWQSYEAELHRRAGQPMDAVFPTALPDAHDVTVLALAELAAGRGLAPELALPNYLRDRVASGGGSTNRGFSRGQIP